MQWASGSTVEPIQVAESIASQSQGCSFPYVAVPIVCLVSHLQTQIRADEPSPVWSRRARQRCSARCTDDACRLACRTSWSWIGGLSLGVTASWMELTSLHPGPAPPTSLPSFVLPSLSMSPWLVLQVRDLATAGNSSHHTVSLICAIVGGTSAGVVIVIVAFLTWKRRWCFQRTRRAPQREHPHRGVLVKKDKRLSTHATEKLASSTSSSRTSSNAIASEKAQLAGVLPIAVAPPPPKMDNVRATVMAVKQTPPIVRPTSVHLRPPKPRTVACAEVRSPLADHLNNGLSYKSSTITCSSVYSTQSGEERQVRVPPSVILAALGPNMDRLSSVVEHTLAPPGGSVEPISSFKPPGEVGQEPNRLSHISAGSLPLNVQAVDHASSVGLAYGGEEEQES